MVEHQVRHWVVIWCFLFVPQIETNPVYYSLVKSLFVWWSTSHIVKISIWAGGFQVIWTSHENPHIAEIPICRLNYQLVPNQPSAESVVSPSVLTENYSSRNINQHHKSGIPCDTPIIDHLNPLSRSSWYIKLSHKKKKHQFPPRNPKFSSKKSKSSTKIHQNPLKSPIFPTKSRLWPQPPADP